MAWEKSPTDAITIAKQLGMPIGLASESIFVREHSYFNEEIAPQIDGKTVMYIGAVDDSQKSAFLGGASALLFPIASPWAA
jgi:hypothetical protein